jgi:hypothetical protein
MAAFPPTACRGLRSDPSPGGQADNVPAPQAIELPVRPVILDDEALALEPSRGQSRAATGFERPIRPIR